MKCAIGKSSLIIKIVALKWLTLLLSLSRQYTVDGQYIPSLFIEPEVRHDKTSYTLQKQLMSTKNVFMEN